MNFWNSKEFAESKKICKICKKLWNFKKLAKSKRITEFKKICKKFFVYKLIILFTEKQSKPQIILYCRRGCFLPQAWLPVWLFWMTIFCFRFNCLLKRFFRFDCQFRNFNFLLIVSVMIECLKTFDWILIIRDWDFNLTISRFISWIWDLNLSDENWFSLINKNKYENSFD